MDGSGLLSLWNRCYLCKGGVHAARLFSTIGNSLRSNLSNPSLIRHCIDSVMPLQETAKIAIKWWFNTERTASATISTCPVAQSLLHQIITILLSLAASPVPETSHLALERKKAESGKTSWETCVEL